MTNKLKCSNDEKQNPVIGTAKAYVKKAIKLALFFLIALLDMLRALIEFDVNLIKSICTKLDGEGNSRKTLRSPTESVLKRKIEASIDAWGLKYEAQPETLVILGKGCVTLGFASLGTSLTLMATVKDSNTVLLLLIVAASMVIMCIGAIMVNLGVIEGKKDKAKETKAL